MFLRDHRLDPLETTKRDANLKSWKTPLRREVEAGRSRSKPVRIRARELVGLAHTSRVRLAGFVALSEEGEGLQEGVAGFACLGAKS